MIFNIIHPYYIFFYITILLKLQLTVLLLQVVCTFPKAVSSASVLAASKIHVPKLSSASSFLERSGLIESLTNELADIIDESLLEILVDGDLDDKNIIENFEFLKEYQMEEEKESSRRIRAEQKTFTRERNKLDKRANLDTANVTANVNDIQIDDLVNFILEKVVDDIDLASDLIDILAHEMSLDEPSRKIVRP